ncbi:hypothetical protein PIB30_022137 [Stylosanthes scabra]|uniref:Uncharacterized protein n=1 Tax=Stylosanthes scabra TaxID=79078 RepID=A0ABU6U9I1_9FABA|nr:hypothetical protein [Stylosanthes scabra]
MCSFWMIVTRENVGLRGSSELCSTPNLITMESSRHFIICVVSACASTGLEWGAYVGPIYSVTNLFKVYEMKSPPIPNENMWPRWLGSKLRPNSTMKRKAKRIHVSTRIRNNESGIADMPLSLPSVSHVCLHRVSSAPAYGI